MAIPMQIWVGLLVALIVPGLLAWVLTRRIGPLGLVLALAVCAVTGFVGWFPTRQPPTTQDAQIAQASVIFLIVTPALISLVLGAVAGFWSIHQRRDRG